MICYSRGKNIREELCTAKLPPARSRLRQGENGFRRCRKAGCRMCPFTGEKGPSTYLDCKHYARETGQTAEERCSQHRNTVVQHCHQGTDKPVGKHFQGAGHSISDMRFTLVEKVFSNNIFVRKACEKQLINKFDLIRKGINKKL